MIVALTPSQTVGPFFSIGLPWGEEGPHAVAPGEPGAIEIGGRVLDGAGVPVPDAVVETWQTMPPVSERFRGFARSPTDDDGHWAIVTLPPTAGADGQAPHVAVTVLARGLLHRVVTRIYLSADSADSLLASVPPERRATLIAVPDGERRYRFDIRLQGPDETVFFAI